MTFRKMSCAGALVLLLAPAAGVAQSGPVSPQQAMGDQGQNVTVEGVATVSDAEGLPGLFVRLNAKGSSTPFAGYISTGNEDKFRDIRALEGKTVDITGVVETSGSIPIIRISSAGQLKVIR
jgi:hypothetical protein